MNGCMGERGMHMAQATFEQMHEVYLQARQGAGNETCRDRRVTQAQEEKNA